MQRKMTDREMLISIIDRLESAWVDWNMLRFRQLNPGEAMAFGDETLHARFSVELSPELEPARRLLREDKPLPHAMEVVADIFAAHPLKKYLFP